MLISRARITYVFLFNFGVLSHPTLLPNTTPISLWGHRENKVVKEYLCVLETEFKSQLYH